MQLKAFTVVLLLNVGAVQDACAQNPNPRASSATVDTAPTVTPASVSSPNNEGFELHSGVVYENLTKGYAPWTDYYIEGIQRLGERNAVYGAFNQTSRFGINDSEFSLGGYVPLGKTWTLNPYGSYSPTHNILSQFAIGTNINHQLGDGWGVELGFEHRVYNPTNIDMERFTAEKYFSDFRLAYTLGLAQGDNTGSTSSHTLSFGYYYSDKSSVNAALSVGSELDSVAPGLVRSFDIRSANVYGSNYFGDAKDWAITYGLGVEVFQPTYTRRKVELGFRHQF